MANFSTHVTVAFLASASAALIGFKAGLLNTTEFLGCALAGTLGGLLPDIDLDHAVPARIGFNLVSLFMAFATVVYWVRVMSVAELAAIGALAYVIVRFGVFGLFNRLSHHRGLVHSLPYMAILALGLILLAYHGWHWSAGSSWFLGLFLWCGAILHLILDEVYSVNIFGLKVKKSFGSAFKVFERAQWGWYVLLYVLVGILLVWAPPFRVFWHNLTDPVSWLILKQSLWPTASVF